MSQSIRVAAMPFSRCIPSMPLFGGAQCRSSKCAAARLEAQADSVAELPQIGGPAIPCGIGGRSQPTFDEGRAILRSLLNRLPCALMRHGQHLAGKDFGGMQHLFLPEI